MGESSCLMQPFSYVAGFPKEAQEGNPIHDLGQSISFGRFMSDSLNWEKWSTFSNNRYVEEAERHSRPGSVAQKKAFFEAHYKKIAAARKEAALLQQENALLKVASESDNIECTNKQGEVTSNVVLNIEDGCCDTNGQDLRLMNIGQECIHSDQVPEHVIQTNLTVHVVNVPSPKNEMDKCRMISKEVTSSVVNEQQKVLAENSMRLDLVNVIKARNEVQDQNEIINKENHTLKNADTNREEKTLSISKKKTVVSSSRPLSYDNSSRMLFSPFKHSGPNSTPSRKNLITEATDKRRLTPKQSHFEKDTLDKRRSSTPKQSHFEKDNVDKRRLTPKQSHFEKDTVDKRRSTTPKPSHFEKDNVDKRRSTPKSSSKLYSFTPAKELNRLTSTIVRKLDGSSIKTSKECKTPQRTPKTASVSQVGKQTLATPSSEKRSSRVPLDSAPLSSKTVRSRWNFLPTENKSSYSPSLFASFGLRTEERAARRKEKLEEKFKAAETQKQLQAKLREEADTEIRKLRRSLCFKARPLPEFYKDRGTPKTRQEPLVHRDPSRADTNVVQNKIISSCPKQSINPRLSNFLNQRAF